MRENEGEGGEGGLSHSKKEKVKGNSREQSNRSSELFLRRRKNRRRRLSRGNEKRDNASGCEQMLLLYSLHTG